MEEKKVIMIDGAYDCDIDVSVDDWKDILQDETLMKKSYKDVLIKFYNEPEHKSSCKALGEKYNISPQHFNSLVLNFGLAVQRKLNRFIVIEPDGSKECWIIPMTGKKVGAHFEYTMRPELVQAMEEIGMNTKNTLQRIYDSAIINKHWVFFEWFPFYENCVKEYIDNAISNTWDDSIFKRLIKNTNRNGISDLQQGNFTWEEFEKIKNNWIEIQPFIKEIAEKNTISKKFYEEVINFFRKQTQVYRWAATNRVIAALLPNVVTTVVAHHHFNPIISNLKKVLLDYPTPTWDWLQDNLNFIDYCNAKVVFQHPWHSSVYAWYLREYFENIESLNRKKTEKMKEYINLLKSNKNLILTGAPGTGKTYLAKQIAMQMIGMENDNELHKSEQLAFVQFHPSYDYTDFVEGLRPTKPDENGIISFELKDGVFKEFCSKALAKKISNFNEIYDQFIDDITQNFIQFETPVMKKNFSIEVNSKKSCNAIPNTEKATKMLLTKEMIRDYVENGNIRDWKPYTTAIGDYIKQNYKINTIDISENNKPFVFIIDEINRGEISKIFGELFFSIDPGYRGVKGAVKTQYSNMHEKDEEFYIPENVYIIGTMNDIDRSVESMDFAIRRRFAWKEIEAESELSKGMLDSEKAWKEQKADAEIPNSEILQKIKNRMSNLNHSIIDKKFGLSTAYQIGSAYFLKYALYDHEDNPFDSLWKNHIRGVLFEYLRGNPKAEELLENLKTAYEDETQRF